MFLQPYATIEYKGITGMKTVLYRLHKQTPFLDIAS